MADVFISYARKTETAFVDRLQDALSAKHFTCWVDREGIFPSSPWRAEIEQAILEADALVFVISPESVESTYCRQELDRALGLGKRLIPVLARDVPDDQIPPALAALQFISFTESATAGADGYERQLAELIEALSTDIEAVHFHTRLLTQSERWSQKGNDRSLLLRGRELTEAERWLDERVSGNLPVLPQQQRLVRESRQAAIRRQRGSVTVALAISVVMALLVALTAVEWRTAVNQRKQAEIQRDRASSLYVAQESQVQLAVDPQLALVLGLKAYDYSPTVQAEDALRSAVAASSLKAVIPPSSTERDESQWPFDPSGHWAVSSQVGYNGVAFITVWDLFQQSGPGSAVNPYTLTINNAVVNSTQFSPDGKDVLALISRFYPAKAGQSIVHQLISWRWGKTSSFKALATVSVVADNNSVKQLPPEPALNRQASLLAVAETSGQVVLQRPLTGQRVATLKPVAGMKYISGLVFSPDGQLLAAIGPSETEIWRADGHRLATFPIGGNGTAAFSPDDGQLAIASVGQHVDIVEPYSPATATIARPLTLPVSLGTHSGDVDEATGLAWSTSGALAVATEDPVVWLWLGPATGPVYLKYTNEGLGFNVAFSPNGQFLLDGSLLWDWQATLDQFLKGQYLPQAISFSPRTNLLAAATQSGGVLLWDWRTSTSGWLVPPKAHLSPTATSAATYTTLSFSPDGNYLAANNEGTVDVWKVASAGTAVPVAPVARLMLPRGWSYYETFQFSPDGRSLLVTGEAATGLDAHGGALDWHWASRIPAAQFVLQGYDDYPAGFSGDQPRLLSTPVLLNGPSKLFVWAGTTGEAPKLVATIPQRDSWSEATVMPGGRVLLADQVGVTFFNLKTRRFGPEVNGYELSYVLSPSDDLAALSGVNGKVEVWDLTASAPLLAFTSTTNAYPSVAWGSSGSVLGVSDPSDGIEVMPSVPYYPFAQLLPIAQSLAVTSLTKAEQDEFLP
ncbi:MAG TPA: toll/interleukin-1 receptor domain-containing protein [Acidimicrobiales bacterium]|nr:toll/interleukin-1 receptor domain-containing protein [Acidimicrobiales bacterium]